MSVHAAIAAAFLKIPAEKSLLFHVQFLRKLLDTKFLEALVWLDTRDMAADGLTKGAVERDLLHSIMQGVWNIQFECRCWSTNKAKQPRHTLESIPGNV